MIALKLFRLAHRQPQIALAVRYSIISNLFRKKNEEQQQTKQPPNPSAEPKKEEGQKERLMEDEAYNFFQRRRQLDTDVDFSKLRQANPGELPQKLGQGGLGEVLYWSQQVATPQQVQQVISAFNNLPTVTQTDNAQMLRFKASVVGSVYLVDSLRMLRDYAVFGLRWGVSQEEFWEKVQFKGVRFLVKNAEQAGYLVDIVFAAGQFQAGEELFNYAQKMLADHDLSAEQYIKLFLVFSSLKRGEKPWIQQLLRGILDKIKETDAQQLTGVLASLKQAKKLPLNMNERVQGQVQHLLPTLTLPELLEVSHYFGFQMEDEAFWGRIQARAVQLLSGKEVGPKLLEEIVLKAVLSYRLSTDFVRKHIVPHCTTATLDKLPPRTLSGLSKGLYIYQLQKQTDRIQDQIGRMLIGKISQDINQISDAELVGVIQDYNLTRHGARELYIFFEEVIKVKFLRHYNPEADRNTIELLASIYENSGMCSRDMLDQLNNLILE